VWVRDSLETLGMSLPPAQVVPEGTGLTYRRLVRWGDVVYIALNASRMHHEIRHCNRQPALTLVCCCCCCLFVVVVVAC